MLKNKIIVITGGAGLIGHEFAKSVIKYNGTVVIADVNEALGIKVKKNLEETLAPQEISFFKIDINKKKSINKFIDNVHKKYGKIDALVNNAYPRNKNYGRHFFDVKYDDFVENLGLNLGGYFVTSQQFAQYFKKQGYGNIVNISSIYGVVAPRFEIYEGTSMTMPVEYAAIKSGLIHLTKYMAKYFKGMNIRVNAISPGGIFDHQPESFLEKYKECCLNKGMLDASDLRGALIFLLSDMSKHINGQNIIVDDGFCL